MVTAMIRTADDAVDKELDYSRYNLGIRELWNTGNSPIAAGKQLTPGIDVSSLMGGNSLDIGSVFDIAGIRPGASSPSAVQAMAEPGGGGIGTGPEAGPDESGMVGNSVQAAAEDEAAEHGSKVGNFAANAVIGGIAGQAGIVGQVANLAGKLGGFNMANELGEFFGINSIQSPYSQEQVEAIGQKAAPTQAEIDAMEEEALTPGLQENAPVEGITAAPDLAQTAADAMAAAVANSTSVHGMEDAPDIGTMEGGETDDDGMSGMGDASQGGGPDGPSGGNDAGDGSW